MSDTEIRTRVYRSELRLRQAEETRRSIIDAAADLFVNPDLRHDLAKIAARAEISVETGEERAGGGEAAMEVRSFGVEGDRDVFEITFRPGPARADRPRRGGAVRRADTPR